MRKREIKLRWFAALFVLVAVMIGVVTLLASQSNSFTKTVIAENLLARPGQVMANSLPTTPAVVANSLVEDIVCLKGDKGGCPTAGSGYGDIFQIDLMSGKYKYTDCPSSPLFTEHSGNRFPPLIPGNRMVTGIADLDDPISLGNGCKQYHFKKSSSVAGGKPVVEGNIVRCSNILELVTGRVEIRYASILPSGGKASIHNILCDTILTPSTCTCGT